MASEIPPHGKQPESASEHGQSPTVSSSPEARSGRLNPFQDSESARKRRRMHGSDFNSPSDSDSETRSGTAEKTPQTSSTSDSHQSRSPPVFPSVESQEIEAETRPKTPTRHVRTPERQIQSLYSGDTIDSEFPPPPPSASRITINLRTPLPTESTSCSSPSKMPSIPAVDQQGDNDVDMNQRSTAVEVSASIYDVDFEKSPEGDACDGSFVAEGSDIFADPTDDFPFRDTEPFDDTISRLCSYIDTLADVFDASLFHPLTNWIESWLKWAHTNEVTVVYESIKMNPGLWSSLPDLVWSVANRRIPEDAQVTAAQYQTLVRFVDSFSKMASYMALVCYQVFDTNFIQGDSSSMAFFYANSYLSTLQKGMSFVAEIAPLADCQPYYSATDIAYRFCYGTDGTVRHIIGILETVIAIAPRYPKFLDGIKGAISIMAALSNIVLFSTTLGSGTFGDVFDLTAIFSECRDFYYRVVEVTDLAMSDHLSVLTVDGLVPALLRLDIILKVGLMDITDEKTVAILDCFAENNPSVSRNLIPQAISCSWRFKVYSKLIQSSHMQLRVAAASEFCQSLVSLWQKHGNQTHPECSAFLEFVSTQIYQCGVLDYIISPTCHPEVLHECFNIIGFLAITRHYTTDHLEKTWEAISACQNSRATDALLRTLCRVLDLFDYSMVVNHCEKLSQLPWMEFSKPNVKLFTEAVLKAIVTRKPTETNISRLPFSFCLRLLRESTSRSVQANSNAGEVFQMALSKLKDLFRFELDADDRDLLFDSCVADIAQKSDTSIGSIWAIYTAVKTNPGNYALHHLTETSNLSALIVDELEHAVNLVKGSGQNVLVGSINNVRHTLIYQLILREPATLTHGLGARLWSLLVGPKAASQMDRRLGWDVLNGVTKQGGKYSKNPFIETCFSLYLHTLPSNCLEIGALEFVKMKLLPRLSEPECFDNVQLDDETSVSSSGIEMLWRIALLSPDDEVSAMAVSTLARDVYTESFSVRSYPHHRARQVHLSLLTRCVEQLEASAQEIRSPDAPASTKKDEDTCMESSPEPEIEPDHVQMFLRSLSILSTFMTAYKAQPKFSSPDIGPLIPASPSPLAGERLDFKLQKFDGPNPFPLESIEIGNQNSLGSLLSKIQHVTGFENFRLFHGGRLLCPNKSTISQTLLALKIVPGLLIVKKEQKSAASGTGSHAGASWLEQELLSHFDNLWEYLAFSDDIASQIYHLLRSFPPHKLIIDRLVVVGTDELSSIPSSHPFQALYTLSAIKEIAALPEAKESAQEDTEISDPRVQTLVKVFNIVTETVENRKFLDFTQPHVGQLGRDLIMTLSDVYNALLACNVQENAPEYSYPTAARLIELVALSIDKMEDTTMMEFVLATIKAMFQLAGGNVNMWRNLSEDRSLCSLLCRMLTSQRPAIRTGLIAILSGLLTTTSNRVHREMQISTLLWPLVVDSVAAICSETSPLYEVYNLAGQVVLHAAAIDEMKAEITAFCNTCMDSLLLYTTTESIGSDSCDMGLYGLSGLINICLQVEPRALNGHRLSNLGVKLFWTHLFPHSASTLSANGHGVAVSRASRDRLYEVVKRIIEDDKNQRCLLLNALNELVPFQTDDGFPPYSYDLSYQFDRSTAIRNGCGYVGLRNLSNTCYLNSLFTQLFMNVGFRAMILDFHVDDANAQELLVNTQRLFSTMQNTFQRFADPSYVVHSIKTYDDGPIDINNQMDVDEFYNLLFDRLESQTSTAEQKKRIRSFFGGQIVQQVKSLECEHVSERLEPFSAIQCDIKEKTTLAESLQAYVNGELMDGDNKYKCSTCDRHVDAVKRACFQEIPDNLIFHLKRFDFNLRTLQRSKINDYFSFPTTIDMSKYTSAYLTSPETPIKPDYFELVGILVHSGTAESGHYYSYIKERSSAAQSGWFEFNDDYVSPWNSSMMETSTFGGMEAPDMYDSSAGPTEKPYSAYMLFYQRSSSLPQADAEVQVRSSLTPVQVPVPAAINLETMEENYHTLRRHCLYDQSHIRFVEWMFTKSHKPHEEECGEAHEEQRLGMFMFLGHLDQVISRAKQIPDFLSFTMHIKATFSDCSVCAMDFFRYFHLHKESFRVLIQRSPDATVRLEIGSIMIRALGLIREQLPEKYFPIITDASNSPSVLGDMMEILSHLWGMFHMCIRAWDELFAFFLGFAHLGDVETAKLLDHDYLIRFTRIVSADQSLDLTPEYSRTHNIMLRRAANLRPVSIAYVLSIIDHFFSCMVPKFTQECIVDGPEERSQWLAEKGLPLPWSAAEINVFHQKLPHNNSNAFIEKICFFAQATSLSDRLIKRLATCSSLMENQLYVTIRNGIRSGMTNYRLAPYMRYATWYCKDSRNFKAVVNLMAFIANAGAEAQSSEGKLIVVFFHIIQEHARTMMSQGQSDYAAIRREIIAKTAVWAPSLLCYSQFENAEDVRTATESFLDKTIFDYGAPAVISEEDGGAACADIITATARDLGLACLRHLNDVVIPNKVHMTPDTVAAIQSTIAKCTPYFDSESESMEDMSFFMLSQTVPVALQPLIVDQVDEDGSEWDQSDESSDQYIALNDLQIQGVAMDRS